MEYSRPLQHKILKTSCSALRRFPLNTFQAFVGCGGGTVKTPDNKSPNQVSIECWRPADHNHISTCFFMVQSEQCPAAPDHHLALRTPDIWLWSARWRKTIRLSRHLRLTPRGLEVITHLLRILTGQLSLGSAAISLSATSCKGLWQLAKYSHFEMCNNIFNWPTTDKLSRISSQIHQKCIIIIHSILIKSFIVHRCFRCDKARMRIVTKW